MKKILFLLLIFTIIQAQDESTGKHYKAIPLNEFESSVRHWYFIDDGEHIIKAVENQQRYDSTEITKIADNIILFQKNDGGWPKNYDMQAILTPEQYKIIEASKDDETSTFDNTTTYSHIRYLARVYEQTKIDKYKEAAIRGLKFTIEAQYDNGGWPQYFPDTHGYRKYITYNDGAMIGIMQMLKSIVDGSSEYSFLDEDLRKELKKSYEKGIECILNTQIEENGVLTAWCQQHDNIDLHPQNARTFEPASICNRESAEIVLFLMSIENPSPRVIKAVESAVKWFEDSKIYGIRTKWVQAPEEDMLYRSRSDRDRIVVKDSTAPPIWTRFYELKTHTPIFCRREGNIVYSLAEVERERRIGYAWYVYDPQWVLDGYPEWKKKYLPAK